MSSLPDVLNNTPNFRMEISKGVVCYNELHKKFSKGTPSELVDVVKKIIYEKTKQNLDLEYVVKQEGMVCSCRGYTTLRKFTSKDPKKKAMLCRYSQKPDCSNPSYEIRAWWKGNTEELWEGDQKILTIRGF